MIEIDGLLIKSLQGVEVGVPGWATAPTLREALFTVALVKGRYNISHQPTRMAMPGSYGELDEALEVCRQLCELLDGDAAWWDPYQLTMPGELRDWIKANPEARAAMMRIMEGPASYEKWPVRELE